MEKYLKDSSRLDVVLDREHENFKCELILHSARRGGQIVVRDQSPEIHACIDLAVEKLSRQLVKSKDRRTDHHRGNRREDETTITTSGEEKGEEPSYEDIINREIKGE